MMNKVDISPVPWCNLCLALVIFCYYYNHFLPLFVYIYQVVIIIINIIIIIINIIIIVLLRLPDGEFGNNYASTDTDL